MNKTKLKEIITLEEGRNEREYCYEGLFWNTDKQEGYVMALKMIYDNWDSKPEETSTIRIEIGECLLEAIHKILDFEGPHSDGGKATINDCGYAIKDAFGIDFTKIVDNKFIELKKPNCKTDSKTIF